MREILFKAKRIDNGEWTEGYYECDPDLDIHYICGFNYYSSENGLEREFFNDEVNKETICQYTGLTDKNGNKIWENDICYNVIDKCVICYGIYDNNSYCEEHMGFYINWEKLKNKYRQDIGYWTSEIEVIGNIFDNPELLEDEQMERLKG